MRYISSTIERDSAKLPDGFDSTDCEAVTRKVGNPPRDVTFTTIPVQIGVFEGNETPEELLATAEEIFGSEVDQDRKEDDGSVIFPKGTKMTFAIANTMAWRLFFQKHGYDLRTPEGAGRLSDEQYAAIGKLVLAADKPAYIKQLTDDPSPANFKRFLHAWWTAQGKPSLA